MRSYNRSSLLAGTWIGLFMSLCSMVACRPVVEYEHVGLLLVAGLVTVCAVFLLHMEKDQ